MTVTGDSTPTPSATPREETLAKHLREMSDPARLRFAFGRFMTGVAIVTFDSPAGRRGLTVNSFTSVSIEPRLLLVSVAKTTAAHDLLFDRPFAVNILGAEQQQLALQFAGRPSMEPQWTDGATAPYLTGALAHFECDPWRHYDGGDHTLFLGEIRDFSFRSGDALGFVGSRFTTVPEFDAGVEDLM